MDKDCLYAVNRVNFFLDELRKPAYERLRDELHYDSNSTDRFPIILYILSLRFIIEKAFVAATGNGWVPLEGIHALSAPQDFAPYQALIQNVLSVSPSNSNSHGWFSALSCMMVYYATVMLERVAATWGITVEALGKKLGVGPDGVPSDFSMLASTHGAVTLEMGGPTLLKLIAECLKILQIGHIVLTRPPSRTEWKLTKRVYADPGVRFALLSTDLDYFVIDFEKEYRLPTGVVGYEDPTKVSLDSDIVDTNVIDPRDCKAHIVSFTNIVQAYSGASGI